MIPEKLTEYILNIFNSCIQIKHNYDKNIIYWYYDENFIRKQKMCLLNNKSITKPKKLNGIVLFIENKNNKKLTYNINEIKKIIEKLNNNKIDFSDYYSSDSMFTIFLDNKIRKIPKFKTYNEYFNTNNNIITFHTYYNYNLYKSKSMCYFDYYSFKTISEYKKFFKQKDIKIFTHSGYEFKTKTELNNENKLNSYMKNKTFTKK